MPFIFNDVQLQSITQTMDISERLDPQEKLFRRTHDRLSIRPSVCMSVPVIQRSGITILL